MTSQILTLLALVFLVVAASPVQASVYVFLAIAMDLKAGSIAIVAAVIGLLGGLVFRYVGLVILDALHATFVCYAAAKDHSLRWTRTEELERLISLTIVDPIDEQQKPDA